MRIFRIFRITNLFIVAATQYVLQYIIIRPAFLEHGIEALLDHLLFFLFVLDTVLITASGYIVNDIIDYEADQINKPGKNVVGKQLAVKSAWILYAGIVIAGLLIAAYIGYRVDKIYLVLIYPLAVWILYLYSVYFKKQAIIGNVVVAAFCAFVAGIVFFAEHTGLMELSQNSSNRFDLLYVSMGAYIIYAFFSTMYREVIKDIEDMEGDRAMSYRTFPITGGIERAKIFAQFNGILLLLSVLILIFYLFTNDVFIGGVFLILGVVIPLIWSMMKLAKAKNKASFSLQSKVAKIIMAMGLLFLVFFNQYLY